VSKHKRRDIALEIATKKSRHHSPGWSMGIEQVVMAQGPAGPRSVQVEVASQYRVVADASQLAKCDACGWRFE